MMIIPSYAAITENFREVIKNSGNNGTIRSLVMMYMCAWEFNEDWYLDNNPDLSAAIPSKDFPTGFAHFSAVGYMEGRLPAEPAVDAAWYMANYPDVAAAIIKGTFESPAHHFSTAGYKEGRLPGDPEIQVEWYARAYLPSLAIAADRPRECLHHFMNVGYLNGALPRQKAA